MVAAGMDRAAAIISALDLRRFDAVAAWAAGLFAASGIVLSAILALTGLAVDWTGLGVCLAFCAAALTIGLALKLAGGMPRVADLTLVAAALIGSTVCNIISVNAGLSLGFPLVDGQLRAGDALLGVDAVSLVENFVALPRLTASLNLVYVHSNWIAVLVVLAQALRRDARVQAMVCYAGGLLVVTLVSTLLPAIGSIAFAGLDRLEAHGLPADAGTYHLAVFHYYREGGALIDNAHLSGVAVFPSFHTIMGLIIATSLHGSRFGPLGILLGAVTLVSTVPIGGHYVVDVAAGVVVWAGLMRLAQYRVDLRTPSRPVVLGPPMISRA